MAQKKKVRLSDIAAKLNISTVTVSKALADKEGVGDELRQQIKDVAEQMGYQVKKSGYTSTGSTVTGNIGILIPSRFFSPNVSFYWHIFNTLPTELLGRGYYSIMELLSSEDEQAHTLPRLLSDNKVDGLIILGQTSDAYLEELNKKYQNFILFDFYSAKLQYDSVSNDNYFCSYLMTDYVISQGHKKIRFVGNFGATTSISDRFMGFQKAMLENQLNCQPEDIINDRDENGTLIKINLPPAKNMPTAFVCNSDETAANLILALEEKGYKVPQDISVTGFDNYLPQKQTEVELTTVYIKPEETTRVAAELIINKITGQPYIKGRHLVSGSLVIRNSVKALS
jgi:LacI family transcriptional regulator